jgi:hypothetical protein
MLEVPESITIFILMLLFILLNVVHQLIVGKDLFVVVIIDRANNLYVRVYARVRQYVCKSPLHRYH